MTLIKTTLLGMTAALLTAFGANAENVTLITPGAFQALALSPNGKWACGVFVDGTMETHGFRWNLESGNIELLDTHTSTAWDIADDGTVSGDFTDYEALPNGAPTSMPGYWRDGTWHHIEMPKGTITDGMGCCISPDGQYMVGSICVNGYYTPYIWKNGAIHRDLSTGNHAVAMAVSPDGNAAAGYNTINNRTACYWPPKGNIIYFMDSKLMSQSPWNYARSFSPDGTKLLYWGGWELEGAGGTDDDLYLYAIYDLTTGERHRVKAPSYDSDLEFFDISNSSTLVGYNQSRGYVWTDGEGMYIDDYLAKRGVDLSSFDGFYGQGDHYADQLPINRVVAISGDDSVILVNYYDTIGESRSMVIKIDQDISNLSPAEVKAQQLTGLNTVSLTWQRPVGGNSIRGYNIYCNGKKVNGLMPVNVPYYYHKTTPGTYEYTVAAINSKGAENHSETVTVTVGAAPVEAPASVFARQKGINSIYASWSQPMSGRVHKRYFDPDKIDSENFSVYGEIDVELAIRFDKNEIANYAGYKVGEVTFYPTEEQAQWTVNLYTRDSDGKLSLIYTQPVTQQLKYNELNTVKLDQAVDLPKGDLIAAIEVMTKNDTQHLLGRQSGAVKATYSDLLRLKVEDDFYSTYESSIESALYITALSWAIDLGLQTDSYDDNAVTLSHYNLYVDGKESAQTAENTYTLDDVADGKHTLGVEAVYTDGSISDRVESPISITADYKPIKAVDVKTEATTVSASWSAPTDCDLTDISYTSATRHTNGIKGNAENSYAIMAGAIYPATMVKGYDGYRIKSFRFYPLADAIFTFILTANGKEVAYVEVDDFVLGQWNEVLLDQDIYIDGKADYVLALDCFDPEPDVPLLAIDNTAPRPNISDMYSTDYGETWNSLTVESSTYGNWMIGMTVEDTETKPVAVDGYDVLIDGTVRNTSKLSDTEFKYDFEATDTKNHRLRVDVYYPAKAEAVAGETTLFKLDASGIEDSFIANIHLRQGTNYLVAEGEGVESLAIYSVNGMLMAYADGDKADITGLASGIYLVKITANGQTATRKINILR